MCKKQTCKAQCKSSRVLGPSRQAVAITWPAVLHLGADNTVPLWKGAACLKLPGKLEWLWLSVVADKSHARNDLPRTHYRWGQWELLDAVIRPTCSTSSKTRLLHSSSILVLEEVHVGLITASSSSGATGSSITILPPNCGGQVYNWPSVTE